jgi:hypothetical protein
MLGGACEPPIIGGCCCGICGICGSWFCGGGLAMFINAAVMASR